MSAIIGTHLLYGFGNTCLPQLPPRWFTVERAGMFVVAVSPDNRLYFVGREELIPIIKGFADTQHSIKISTFVLPKPTFR